jgi:hypothetical protein
LERLQKEADELDADSFLFNSQPRTESEQINFLRKLRDPRITHELKRYQFFADGFNDSSINELHNLELQQSLSLFADQKADSVDDQIQKHLELTQNIFTDQLNDNHDIQVSRAQHFLETHIADQAFIPSPDEEIDRVFSDYAKSINQFTDFINIDHDLHSSIYTTAEDTTYLFSPHKLPLPPLTDLTDREAMNKKHEVPRYEQILTDAQQLFWAQHPKEYQQFLDNIEELRQVRDEQTSLSRQMYQSKIKQKQYLDDVYTIVKFTKKLPVFIPDDHDGKFLERALQLGGANGEELLRQHLEDKNKLTDEQLNPYV